MLDVAAVALTFLQSHPARAEREAAAFGLSTEEYARLASFFAGLHDLGKFTRNIQFKRADLWPEALGARPVGIVREPLHWQATAALLSSSPLNADFRRYAPQLHAGAEYPLVAAIAGHHGRPPSDKYLKIPGGGGGWIDAACIEAARAAFSRLEGLASPAYATDLDDDSVAAVSWRLSGLITLADWIGSDADHFGPAPLDIPLEVYWREAQRCAAEALTAKGLTPLKPAARLRLADFAPAAAAIAPRPMQGLAETVALGRGPQLVVIEDSTGSGKTEAVILLAARMMAARLGEGLYIALPTMATANAMHERLGKIVKKLFAPSESGEPSLILSHGKAELSRAMAALRVNVTQDGEETTAASCNAWIADDRRRAFFADVGVGTIDQAFLAVLPKKHLTLRQYALAGRILIVDEAHCFDAYMKEELSALLRLHAMNGGSAIVLSATLSQKARRKTAEAFFNGLGQSKKQSLKQARACVSVAYPLMTCVDASGVRELESPLAEGLARSVRIVRGVPGDHSVVDCRVLRDVGRL